MQNGLGTSIQTINNLFTQGALARTAITTDLAVAGNGFFVVRDPVNGETFVTRAGDFRVDENGYLVSNTGLRVQGYSDAALTTIGDIRIDATGMPATSDPNATVVSFAIDRE